jgi:hypothetical protein
VAFTEEQKIVCYKTILPFYLKCVAFDISSDLTELSRTPVTVVCAGVKSILDIPKTLEYLVSFYFAFRCVSTIVVTLVIDNVHVLL